MGYYINPKQQTKEEFLAACGRLLELADVRAFDFDQGELPVCLVDNGVFTAAAIAYDARERDYFLREDHRPKTWYAVPAVELAPYFFGG